jgi:hypothetical protein
VARPTKLTPDVQQDLVYALSEGAAIAHACDYAGISERTYYDWMARGEAGEEAFAQFLQTITRARGRGVLRHLGTISRASEAGSWQAAGWLLQHRYPQEYGAKLKIQGDADNPLRVLHEMPEDQLSRKIQQLLHTLGYSLAPAAAPPREAGGLKAPSADAVAEEPA